MTKRLSLSEVARQLGLSTHRASRIVATYAWLAQPKGTPPTYHPTFVTRYRAMQGRPHLSIEPRHRDWLARYQGEQMSQPAPARRRRATIAEAGVPGGLDPQSQINPGAESLEEDGVPNESMMVFPGELLTQSSTLAIVLPGDSKESYFGARHVAIVQPDEDAEDVVLRGIAVINSAVEANINDTVQRWTPPPVEAGE